MDAKLICFKEDLFYEMLDIVADRLAQHDKIPIRKWLSQEEAMKLLNIKSRTTLQEYRNGGRIRFSQPSKKVILYDRDSIYDFLEDNAVETF